MHANKTFFYFLLALKLQKYTLFVFAVYTAFLTTQITTMTYYIYQRNAYGFVKQLGFAFDKSQAIEKAKQYATNLQGDFAIEVHANGVKSEKVFDSKAGNGIK